MNKCRNLDNALKKFIELNPSFYDKYESIKESLRILDDMDFCEDTSTVIREPKHEDHEDMESSSTSVSGKAEGSDKNGQVLIPKPLKSE